MSILDIIEGNLDPNWSVINDTSKLRLHMLSLSVILNCLTKRISEFSNLKFYFVTIAFGGN